MVRVRQFVLSLLTLFAHVKKFPGNLCRPPTQLAPVRFSFLQGLRDFACFCTFLHMQKPDFAQICTNLHKFAPHAPMQKPAAKWQRRPVAD